MIIAINLKFAGNCAEALEFYTDLFHATLICKHLYSPQLTTHERLLGKVFHAELRVKDFYMYMSDTDDAYDANRQAFTITVECDSIDQAQHYFDTLSKGGQVLEPMTKMPWGPTMGHLRDTFGITWDLVYCG